MLKTKLEKMVVFINTARAQILFSKLALAVFIRHCGML